MFISCRPIRVTPSSTSGRDDLYMTLARRIRKRLMDVPGTVVVGYSQGAKIFVDVMPGAYWTDRFEFPVPSSADAERFTMCEDRIVRMVRGAYGLG